MKKTTSITRCLFFAGAFAGLMLATASANNLQVGNVRLMNHDAFAKTIDVVFNLQWDNAWRGTYDGVESWDAAWVFVKFKAPGATEWAHVWIDPDSVANSATSGTVDIGRDIGEPHVGRTGHTGDLDSHFSPPLSKQKGRGKRRGLWFSDRSIQGAPPDRQPGRPRTRMWS